MAARASAQSHIPDPKKFYLATVKIEIAGIFQLKSMHKNKVDGKKDGHDN